MLCLHPQGCLRRGVRASGPSQKRTGESGAFCSHITLLTCLLFSLAPGVPCIPHEQRPSLNQLHVLIVSPHCPFQDQFKAITVEVENSSTNISCLDSVLGGWDAENAKKHRVQVLAHQGQSGLWGLVFEPHLVPIDRGRPQGPAC